MRLTSRWIVFKVFTPDELRKAGSWVARKQRGLRRELLCIPKVERLERGESSKRDFLTKEARRARVVAGMPGEENILRRGCVAC